jgi:hypothetical protein
MSRTFEMAPFLGSLVESLGGIYALISLFCAWLFSFLISSPEITVLIKKNSQLTPSERKAKEKGLLRSIVLQTVLFVPASVFLVLLIVRPILAVSPVALAFITASAKFSASGLLGILSYQFPFAAVKRAVTHFALRTLQKFASITIDAQEH